MNESESEGADAPIEIDANTLLIVATDRLVWIRLLEKAVNDIDGILGSLKNDIAEITMSMQMRDAGETVEGESVEGVEDAEEQQE